MLKKLKQLILKHVDKVLHFALSYMIASILYTFTGIVGLVITLLLGITIEIIDSRSEHNHFCWWDLLADGIGVALVVIIL